MIWWRWLQQMWAWLSARAMPLQLLLYQTGMPLWQVHSLKMMRMVLHTQLSCSVLPSQLASLTHHIDSLPGTCSQQRKFLAAGLA